MGCYNQVYGSYLVNAVVGEIFRIDFVFRNNSVVTKDSNTILNVPGEAVDNLYIRNDGPASIQYSVNAPNKNELIGGVLVATMNREFKWDKANIKSVNIFIKNDGVNLMSSVAIDVSK